MVMTVIEAINETATALSNLSKVLEGTAAKTTGVPMDKVGNVESGAKSVASKEADVPVSADAAKQEVTLAEIRAVLAEKSQAGLTGKVKELLQSFDANKLSEIKAEDYGKLMAAAKVLS